MKDFLWNSSCHLIRGSSAGVCLINSGYAVIMFGDGYYGQYSGDDGQSVIDALNPLIVVEKSIVVADDGANVVVTSLVMIVVIVQ